MTSRSIRLRLAAWYSGVLLAALVVFGAGIWLALRAHLMQSLEGNLADRTDGLVQFLELESLGSDLAAIREETREYTSGLPEGDTLRLYGPDGDLLFESPASRNESLYLRQEAVSVLDYRLEIEMGAPLDEVDDTLGSLRNILLASVPAVVLFAAFGGLWLSRKALKPVDEMTQAVERIGPGDLSTRLDVPPSGDEIARLAMAWNGMLGRIEQSVRQVKQFTSDAAHELRTPVAVIRTGSELALRRERSATEYRDTLNGIYDEVQRMSELVDSLMWLARSDAARVEYKVEELPLRDAVSKAWQTMEGLAASCQVHTSLDLDVGPGVTAHADRHAFHRLFLILEDNAIKFTPAGGFVRIRVSASGPACRLEIQDSGIGIEKDDLPYIFDRFYRGDRARHSPGSGLGLSIAAAIVRDHDGTIRAYNLPGSGACVEVTLPLGRSSSRASLRSGMPADEIPAPIRDR